MATSINLQQAVLYSNRLSIPDDGTRRDTHSEDKAWMQSTLMGHFVDIIDFAKQDDDAVGGRRSPSAASSPVTPDVENRHKTVVTRVEFFGLTVRAVCSVALHLLKSAVFCVIHGVTLGRFESEWFKDRIAMEFAGVEVGVQIIQKAAIGVIKPEKALEKGAEWIDERRQTRHVQFNRMLTKNLVSTDASARRKVAQKESMTQRNLTHIAALHATDPSAKKKFETGARYATNLVYSVAALVWNAFTMAIYGIAYAATGSNKALKERLEVTKELLSVTLQSIVESAKGVFNPSKTAEARFEKLDQVVSLSNFAAVRPRPSLSPSVTRRSSTPPARAASDVTQLERDDYTLLTSAKDAVVEEDLRGGYQVGFTEAEYDEDY